MTATADQDERGPTPRIVRTPTPPPMFGSLLSLQSWTSPWASRRLIRSLATRRLQERFRGSWLGAIWVFLLPLLMLAVYSFAFIVVFQVGGANGEQRIERVFTIFCGMIVFGLFNETVQRSATSIVSHPQFVKKVVFPLDALPAVSLGENLALAGASLAILLTGTLLFLGRIHATWLLLPLPLVALAMLALGAGWLVATVGVFVRDLAQALGVVMQMLFFLTPVCYTLQDVPASAREVAAMNPLVPIIETTRGLVLHGSLPSAGTLLTSLVIGAAAMQIGHAVFTARHQRFADVL